MGVAERAQSGAGVPQLDFDSDAAPRSGLYAPTLTPAAHCRPESWEGLLETDSRARSGWKAGMTAGSSEVWAQSGRACESKIVTGRGMQERAADVDLVKSKPNQGSVHSFMHGWRPFTFVFRVPVSLECGWMSPLVMCRILHR